MFSVGDKILYPMHGAGVIVGIEEKKILGEKKSYYVFELPSDLVDVMIPVDQDHTIGLRPVVSREKALEAIELLKAKTGEMEENWNRRYRDNTEKLKTGDIFKTAEVVRDLSRLAEIRTLSQGERKMMLNSRIIFSSELILVLGINQKEADSLMDSAIHSV